jgi:hypothetical protein
MKRIDTIFVVFGAIVFSAVGMAILSKLVDTLWLVYLGNIFFGFAVEFLFISLLWIVLKNQHRSISGRRLLWSRILLILIFGFILCCIGYFQYTAAKHIKFLSL